MSAALLALALAGAGLSRGRAQDAPAATPHPTPLPRTETKLRTYRGSPFVELELQGQRGVFLLDTGANVSGLDGAWLAEAGVEVREAEESTVGGTTGAIRSRKVVLPRFDLGRGFFKGAKFLRQDFSRFKAPGGRQMGLIGTDFLNRYRVCFDYRAGIVRFELRHERSRLPQGLAATTLTYPKRLPTVNVRVAGVDLPCRLDSGACYLRDEPLLDVNQAALDALRAAGVAMKQSGSIRVRGVSGATSLGLWKVEGGLTLGPATLPEVTLVVHRGGSLAGADPLALASGTLLERFGVVVVDPFDRLLWIRRPGKD